MEQNKMYRQLLIIIIFLTYPCHASQELFVDSNPLLLTSDASSNIVDILTKDVLKRIGYDVKMNVLPVERALNNVNQGIDDAMILCRNNKLDSYPNLRQVPEKIIDLQLTAFTTSSRLNIQNWNDLNNFNIGIVSGIKPLEYNLIGHARLVKVKEPTQLFQLLKDKRVDYVIFTYWNGMEYIHSLGLQNQVKVIEQPLATYSMYLYLNKKHEAMIPQLVDTIRLIKEDGHYQQMFEELLAKFFPTGN
jgi:polar amino acid transport system substrate-binding protein